MRDVRRFSRTREHSLFNNRAVTPAIFIFSPDNFIFVVSLLFLTGNLLFLKTLWNFFGLSSVNIS